MTQTPSEILNECKKIVWPVVESFLTPPSYIKEFSVTKRYEKESAFHWELVNTYPKRQGKYIRPMLLLLTCEAMGGKKSQALKTAAAMQISEDWLLIHDDFEDGSTERRGGVTLNKMYGPELAVNAGDALHFIMWKVLAENFEILGNKKAKMLSDEFYSILSRTALGQSTEIKWTKENKLDFDDVDWFFICDGKTSYYTMAGPIRLGAMIAGANRDQLQKLAKFGVRLGRCYQLVDDILDITSDFNGLKKQQGNDIYEGKRTILLGHLLRTANPKDRAKLALILKKSREQKTPKEVGWVMEKMHHYGSIEYAKGLAAKLKIQAYNLFQKELTFLSKEPARSQIKALIDFVLDREY